MSWWNTSTSECEDGLISLSFCTISGGTYCLFRKEEEQLLSRSVETSRNDEGTGINEDISVVSVL